MLLEDGSVIVSVEVSGGVIVVDAVRLVLVGAPVDGSVLVMAVVLVDGSDSSVVADAGGGSAAGARQATKGRVQKIMVVRMGRSVES